MSFPILFTIGQSPFDTRLRKMALISAQSELMEQIMAQVALPATERFFAIRDEAHKPMIFSKGSDGTLYLVVSDPTDGNNRLVNLSSKFKIQGKVTALNVTQDVDLRSYLAFAATDLNRKGSSLHVMHPFQPSEVPWLGDEDLTSRLFEGPDVLDVTVLRIYLVRCSDQTLS